MLSRKEFSFQLVESLCHVTSETPEKAVDVL